MTSFPGTTYPIDNVKESNVNTVVYGIQSKKDVRTSSVSVSLELLQYEHRNLEVKTMSYGLRWDGLPAGPGTSYHDLRIADQIARGPEFFPDLYKKYEKLSPTLPFDVPQDRALPNLYPKRDW